MEKHINDWKLLGFGLRADVLFGVIAPMLFVVGLVAAAQEPPEAPEPRGRRFAVVIGVQKYETNSRLMNLKCSTNDAQELAKRLRRLDYEVTLLVNGIEGQPADQLPTLKQIQLALSTVIGNRSLTENDTVLVAFAGHGVTVSCREEQEKDAAENYFVCPQDASLIGLAEQVGTGDFQSRETVASSHRLISVDNLFQSLKQYDPETQQGCRAGVRMLWVDACRNDPTRGEFTRGTNSATRPKLPPAPGGLIAFFSCSEQQKAYETGDLGHGVFFFFILRALQGDADSNQNSSVSLGELTDYVSMNVTEYVRDHFNDEQSPELIQSVRGNSRALAEIVRIDRDAGEMGDELDLDGLGIAENRSRIQSFEGLPQFRMVWCPPGEFMMGSPVTEASREDDENQVAVELSDGFWIGETEVTQEQWLTLMRSSPWKNYPDLREGDRYPATYVSWNDALEFCERLTLQEQTAGRIDRDQMFTLPTEAQWEYAYRAGSSTSYFWGESFGKANDYAWHRGSRGNNILLREVGGKEGNAWEIKDIAGNCSEWCMDWHGRRLEGGVEPFGEPNGVARIFRGGNVRGDTEQLRAASRNSAVPGIQSIDIGFRVVLIDAGE